MSPPVTNNRPVSQTAATPPKNSFYEQQLAQAKEAQTQAQAEVDRLKGLIATASTSSTSGNLSFQADPRLMVQNYEKQLTKANEALTAAKAKVADINTHGAAGYTPFRIAVADAERAAADAEQAFKVGEADYNGTGIAWSRTSEGDLNNLRSERDRLQADLTALKANGELAWLDGQVSTARANLEAAKAELEAEKRKVGFSPDVAGAQEKVRAAQEALNTAGTQRQEFLNRQQAANAPAGPITPTPTPGPVVPPPPPDTYTPPSNPSQGPDLSATPPAEKTIDVAETEVTVKSGDYIWKLAREHYQTQYAAAHPGKEPSKEEVENYCTIATEANRKSNGGNFENPDLIYPEDKVKLPALSFKVPAPPLSSEPVVSAAQVSRLGTGMIAV